MDLDILLDNYKNTDFRKRVILCILLGLFPSTYMLVTDYDNLQLEKESAIEAVERSRLKYDKGKKKVADLKDLESKISVIESGIEKAKTLLPTEISMNKILSSLGQMEVDFQVKLKSFKPSEKFMDNTDLGYSRIPIKLSLEGDFSQTMQFLDKLVHMDSLTHLRNISFSKEQAVETKEGSKPEVDQAKNNDHVMSSVDLILYKGL